MQLEAEAARCSAAIEMGPAARIFIAGAIRSLPFGFPLLRERAVEELYLRFKLSLTIGQYLSNLLLLASGQRAEIDDF